MKEIQKMEAGKYYLIESTASANSVYFETDALARLFFRYCDYYLKDFLQVKEYVLNKDGWAMIIKVRSAQRIRKYYESIETECKSNDKDLVSREQKGIWWILSERVRLFISTYVRMSNKILGRKGSLVRRKYRRYEFDSLGKAQAYISKIRNDQHELQQPKEKYRGVADQFVMSGTILTNPLRSSLWVEICEKKQRIEEELLKIFGVKLPVLQGLGDLVAPILKIENNSKNPNPNTPKPPNLE